MRCAWESLLAILPARLRRDVDKLGRDTMQELRLRINAPPELVDHMGRHALTGLVTREELNAVVNAASRYSPWAAATTAQGFLTAPGGHRIGLCGEVVCKSGRVEGIRELSSLCIRVARDFPGIARDIVCTDSSVLIIGPPGWGKTTLLRDLIRNLSQKVPVCVIDQRGELFPPGFDCGVCTDILTGCPKAAGINMALRTMGPRYLAVDEITEESDTQAIVHAANCGVLLLATAHAATRQDLQKRNVYRPLLENQVFDCLILLRPDRSYRIERLG